MTGLDVKWVTATPANDRGRNSYSDEPHHGRFDLGLLVPGRWVIEARSRDDVSRSTEVEVTLPGPIEVRLP